MRDDRGGEDRTLSAVAKRIAVASSVVAITGAGTSAESGIPTFREAQSGLWARFRPEELATPEAFERDPETVWRWYQWRRQLVRQARPNAGHDALVELERRMPQFTLITQNVDGLHQLAGSRNVLELHGNIMTTICHRTGREMPAVEPEAQAPPTSPWAADGLGRPGVVWFGEALPAAALTAALEAAGAADVFLSIGTSALVQPAASLAQIAADRGAVVVEVNPEPTPLSGHADYLLRGTAANMLPQLLARLSALDAAVDGG